MLACIIENQTNGARVVVLPETKEVSLLITRICTFRLKISNCFYYNQYDIIRLVSRLSRLNNDFFTRLQATT